MTKVAVVIGAEDSGSIQGLSLLSSLGYALAVISGSEERSGQIASICQGHGIQAINIWGDLTNPSELRRVVDGEQLVARGDAVVCNLAPYCTALGSQLPLNGFESDHLTNEVTANIIRWFLPKMVRRRKGRVVIVAPPIPKSIMANASNEHGLSWEPLALIRQLAIEVGRSEVTINAICEGAGGFDEALHCVREQCRYLAIPAADRDIVSRVFQADSATGNNYPSGLMAYLLSDQAANINGLMLATKAQASVHIAAA